MKQAPLFFIFFFVALGAFSQNLSGKVLESATNRPLEDVNVYLEDGKVGAISNEKGEFHLVFNSPLKPNDSIRFSMIGYTSNSMTFSHLKSLGYVVHLTKKTEHLSEVVVTQKRKLFSQIPFKKGPSMKTGVYHFGSVLIQNSIYLVGGDQSFLEDTEKKVLDEVNRMPNASFSDYLKRMRANFSWETYSDKLQIYSLETDRWTTSDLTFTKRAYHNLIYLDQQLYVLGGKTLSTNKKHEYLSNQIEIFNLETEEIVVDDTNPHQAVNFAAFNYQDNLIVMGGSIKLKKNGEKVYTDAAHIYNTASGYWYELPPLTKPKEVHGVIVDDLVYLVGGFNDKPLTEIESYSLERGEWNQEGHLFSGTAFPALAYSNDIIYIYSNGKISTFNTLTKVLNEYQIGLYTQGSQMHCYNGNLYIMGGFTEDDFTQSPSSSLSIISLDAFSKTKILNSKTFK